MKPRQALFVSGIDGFCHRYAVSHRVRHLRSYGWQVSVLSYRHPDLSEVASRADLLFLYRVPANVVVMQLLDRAVAAGTGRIGLVDDLIFRSEADCLPSFLTQPQQRALWREGADRYANVLALCDEVLASSSELVAEIESLGIESHLYRDALSGDELDLARTARELAGENAKNEVFRVGYFSGTATHDADFSRAATGLARAMQEDPRITLAVLGPLALPSELARFAARITRSPLIPWVELPVAIAAVDLNLAPLDTESRFSRAKGATKVMEASACGVPSIASPTSSNRAATSKGGGWLADTVEEWRDTILASVEQRPAMASAGQQAREHIVGAYGPDSRLPEMKDLLARVESRRSQTTSAGRVAIAPLAVLPEEPFWPGALTPDAFPVLPEKLPLDTSPPLGEGDLLCQEFFLTSPGLFRVDIFTWTYGQRFAHTIGFRLRSRAGEVLEGQSWDAVRLPDRGFFAWDLESPLAAGSFILEVEARGTGPGNAASFGLVQAGPDRSLATINGKEIAGALGIRGFSSWDQVGSRGDLPYAPKTSA